MKPVDVISIWLLTILIFIGALWVGYALPDAIHTWWGRICDEREEVRKREGK